MTEETRLTIPGGGQDIAGHDPLAAMGQAANEEAAHQGPADTLTR